MGPQTRIMTPITDYREEKRARMEMRMANDGNSGPVRRAKWRLVERNYLRYVINKRL